MTFSFLVDEELINFGPGTLALGIEVAEDPGAFPCTEQGIRDAIAEGGGPHQFRCGGPTVVTTGSMILIDNDVILDGQGELTVDGNDDHRVFQVAAGVTAELRGFGVTNGQSAGNGGGIDNGGVLTLRDSEVSRNRAGQSGGGIVSFDAELTLINTSLTDNFARNGGALRASGLLAVQDSVISGNTAIGPTQGDGGGILAAGEVLVTRTTISENTAQRVGGGICFAGVGGRLSVFDTAVSRNGAVSGGGGIYASGGELFLTKSTVSHNSAPSGSGIECFPETGLPAPTLILSTVSTNSGGPAIFVGREVFILNNVTVAANTDGSIDSSAIAETIVRNSIIEGPCTGAPLESSGNNVESGDTCGLNGTSDIVNAGDLKLDPLADNGGSTLTHLPQTDSPAVDAIPATPPPSQGCTFAVDQRDVARPQRTACDIGAVELE